MAKIDARPGARAGRGDSYEPRARDPAADNACRRVGQAIDVLIVKRGRKLRPERMIAAAVKNRLELPEHLTIVPGELERIEASLSSRSTP